MNPEVVAIPFVFGIPAIVIIVRMALKHKERMATLTAPAQSNAALEARLSRIEEAVETIAVEIERMGEGQRFVTKLLAEGAGRLPDGSKDAASARITTPR
jgi:ABC-type Na+ efflux pump permease subunit